VCTVRGGSLLDAISVVDDVVLQSYSWGICPGEKFSESVNGIHSNTY